MMEMPGTGARVMVRVPEEGGLLRVIEPVVGMPTIVFVVYRLREIVLL
jgi:hypothetical protein